jgi:hypothetical protein
MRHLLLIGNIAAISSILAGKNREFAPPTEDQIRSLGIEPTPIIMNHLENIHIIEEGEITREIQAYATSLQDRYERHFGKSHMLDEGIKLPFKSAYMNEKIVNYTPDLPKRDKRGRLESKSKFIPNTRKQR